MDQTPDRGQGASGDPTPGAPDYDWLYGGGAAPSNSSPTSEADHTMVMPVVPRTQDAQVPPASPPPPTRRVPVEPAPRGPRRRGRGFRLRYLLVLVALWVGYLLFVPLHAWNDVSRAAVTVGGDRPAEQPGTTYLVVGSDARKGLAGQRTDTIMVLHTGSGPNLLMSVPRDSLVEVPGHGVTKVNAAFAYGGPKLLIQTLEASTGIRIDDYVEIGFTGFVSLVDAVGGVQICPKTAMKDPLAHLDITKGCQTADGRTALGYSRSRHTQALGDIGRAQHQREVVSAIAGKVVSPMTVLNPFRYWDVVTGGAATVRVSKDMGMVAAGRFAYAMTHVNGKDGLTCGVPIADLAVHWDATRSEQLFQLIRSDHTDRVGKALCSPDGLARN